MITIFNFINQTKKYMSLIKEFKEFIMRGNVLDLAVAVIIGGAFGNVITSFVNDIIMPPIGLLLGNVDFKELKVLLQHGKEAVMNGTQVVTPAVAEVSINYGMFAQTIINFLIIGFCIFMVLKIYSNMTKAKQEAPAAPPAPSKEETLLSEIRDILKSQSK